jgi:Major intrinsic protein
MTIGYGLQVLEHAAATGAALAAIVLAVGSVSGGHLNPVVSCADALLAGLGRVHLAVASSLGSSVPRWGVDTTNLSWDLQKPASCRSVHSIRAASPGAAAGVSR